MGRGIRPFRLLTCHAALFGLSTAMAGGFAGAYLLRLGLPLSAALATHAVLLALRFGMRFLAIGIVRRIGLRGGLLAGTGLGALGLLPLLCAAEPAWLAVWVLTIALAEALYWPAYHAATASLAAGPGRFGRQAAERAMVGALVSVVGPLTGGLLLAGLGEGAGFGIAALVGLLSALPVLSLAPIAAGPVPGARDSLRGDRLSMLAFAADGWIASGLGYAWPMLLFLSLGASYEAFGAANALAGVVAAVASLVCGRAVDAGQRHRYLAALCLALLAAFALRAGAGASPIAALLANASGAAIAGFYGPVVMSAVYERSQRSGAPYRMQLAAEAAWDAGAIAGLLVAAAVAWIAPGGSLPVLPAALGVAVLYVAVRGASAAAPAPRGTGRAAVAS